jgi:FtsH-binding integral membrane protein
MFLIYSFISGITFAAIFLVFALDSIVFVFGLTALLFAVLAFFGYTTKMDLSGLGVIILVTLIGVIIASMVNIFLNNPFFDLIVSVVAVILFMVMIAFDMQKLKEIASGAKSEEELNQLAVFGALDLYLDFINLFINLLKILGRRD